MTGEDLLREVYQQLRNAQQESLRDPVWFTHPGKWTALMALRDAHTYSTLAPARTLMSLDVFVSPQAAEGALVLIERRDLPKGV